MERLAINERISAARERVEAEGRSWGRPRKIDQRAREVIAAMKTSGRSIREIAMAMKIPKSTVARVVSRKRTTGTPPAAP